MPKIIVATRGKWSFGDEPFLATQDWPLAYKLGTMLPQWLLDEMQEHWPGIKLENIRVIFTQQHSRDINPPDIEVTLQMGVKQEPHATRLRDYFILLITSWLDQTLDGASRPSFEFSIELMRWTGALIDREGKCIDDWNLPAS